jgi:hypothetical protein
MTKTIKPTKGPDITVSAVAVVSVSPTLAEAVELIIENGVVTSIKPLTRAPDAPATAIVKAEQALWNQFRKSKGSQ